MSTTEDHLASHGASSSAHGEHAADTVHGDLHDDHKPDGFYVKVAIVLAVVTALEVALAYIEGLDGLALLIPLFLLMALKFVVVASLFMHLRFDNRLLTQVFYAGLILAVSVYIAALATFEIFS